MAERKSFEQRVKELCQPDERLEGADRDMSIAAYNLCIAMKDFTSQCAERERAVRYVTSSILHARRAELIKRLEG